MQKVLSEVEADAQARQDKLEDAELQL